MVSDDFVPAHIFGDCVAGLNHILCLGVTLRQARADLHSDALTDVMLDLFAHCVVDFQQGFNFVCLVAIKASVVGDDEIFCAFCAGDVEDEAGTAADAADDADSAERQRLKLGDSEWLVNALAELDVAAPADVHKFHIGWHSLSAGGLGEAELVDEDDFDISASGVEFLDACIEVGLSAGQVGRTFAVRDGPVVGGFHFINIAVVSLGDLGREDEQDGGFVLRSEFFFHMFEHAQVAPQAFASDEARDVREDVIGFVAEQGFAVSLELGFGFKFVGERDLMSRDAVIDYVDVGVFKFGREESQLADDVIADGADSVTVF